VDRPSDSYPHKPEQWQGWTPAVSSKLLTSYIERPARGAIADPKITAAPPHSPNRSRRRSARARGLSDEDAEDSSAGRYSGPPSLDRFRPPSGRTNRSTSQRGVSATARWSSPNRRRAGARGRLDARDVDFLTTTTLHGSSHTSLDAHLHRPARLSRRHPAGSRGRHRVRVRDGGLQGVELQRRGSRASGARRSPSDCLGALLSGRPPRERGGTRDLRDGAGALASRPMAPTVDVAHRTSSTPSTSAAMGFEYPGGRRA